MKFLHFNDYLLEKIHSTCVHTSYHHNVYYMYTQNIYYTTTSLRKMKFLCKLFYYFGKRKKNCNKIPFICVFTTIIEGVPLLCDVYVHTCIYIYARHNNKTKAIEENKKKQFLHKTQNETRIQNKTHTKREGVSFGILQNIQYSLYSSRCKIVGAPNSIRAVLQLQLDRAAQKSLQ